MQKKVICSQLGYVGINKLENNQDYSNISPVSASMRSIECEGTEATIQECKIKTLPHGAACETFATVSCGGGMYHPFA